MKFRFWYVFVILGIFFALISIFFIFFAVSIKADELRGKDTDMTSDVPIFCCLPFFLPEALIFLGLGIVLWRKNKNQKELASRLESYRIIKISELSRKMGKSDEKTRKMVKTCIRRDYIKGRLDRSERTFFTTEYLENTKGIINGWKCSSCGAMNDGVLLPGEVGQCASCGDILDNTDKIESTVDGKDLLPEEQKKKRFWNKKKDEAPKQPEGPRVIGPPPAVKEMTGSVSDNKER